MLRVKQGTPETESNAHILEVSYKKVRLKCVNTFSDITCNKKDEASHPCTIINLVILSHVSSIMCKECSKIKGEMFSSTQLGGEVQFLSIGSSQRTNQYSEYFALYECSHQSVLIYTQQHPPRTSVFMMRTAAGARDEYRKPREILNHHPENYHCHRKTSFQPVKRKYRSPLSIYWQNTHSSVHHESTRDQMMII